MVLKEKSPALCRGFFDSCLIVSDWVKLFCNLDVVCFVWFMCFSSLTWDFARKFRPGCGTFRLFFASSVIGCDSMAGMGVISRSIDKLPSWLKVVLMVLGLAAFVYGVATEGWIFILKAIFSPEI